jgi:hypothetical protein
MGHALTTLVGVAASNDNGREDLRVLQARFHPDGRADAFAVVGRIVCRGPWAVLELDPDFERRIPACCSGATIITNLRYLTIMSRPNPFENLRTVETPHWSFVSPESET